MLLLPFAETVGGVEALEELVVNWFALVLKSPLQPQSQNPCDAVSMDILPQILPLVYIQCKASQFPISMILIGFFFGWLNNTLFACKEI